jgi:hypothetical protein
MTGTFFYKNKTNGKSEQRLQLMPSQKSGPVPPKARVVKSPNAANRQLLRRQRIDIHPSSGPIETNVSIHQCKNGVVATKPNIFTRQKFRSALPDNDVAGDDQLTSKFFNAQPLADAIAPVLYATLSLFVSHD